MKHDSFKGVGGLNIFTCSWQPDGAPRAVVVLSHGFNSHSGYYTWVGEQLAASGLAVYALDHRGRGQSEGERFFVEKFADYEQDLATFIQLVKASQPGLPVFLYGHSAGGVLACNYALDYQAELAGLICASFAFRVPAPDFVLSIMKGLSHVLPHAHVLKLVNEHFSRDPKVVAFMNSDPLIANETQPTLTVAEMVRADERLERDFGLIKLPVLIIHGTEDKATKPEGSQFFYERAGSVDKTLKLYEGYFHDPLSDVGKEVVLADIRGWIDAHIPT